MTGRFQEMAVFFISGGIAAGSPLCRREGAPGSEPANLKKAGRI